MFGINTRARKLLNAHLVAPGSAGYKTATRVWGPGLRAALESELRAELESEMRAALVSELRDSVELEAHEAWEERFWGWYLTRDRTPERLAVDGDIASRILFERLDHEDVEAIRRVIRADAEFQWCADDTSESARRLLLHLGVWKGIPAATEKTGLRAVAPPEDIHAMARGPFAAGGGLYEADMIAAAFASAGVDPATLGRVLDFGCSSGRAVRALAATYPRVNWLGCDPNGPAIEWAQTNLPDVEFFQSGDNPPLALASGSLDAVYAISIWSHFEPSLGLEWFDEMHRVILPGGHMIFTTHGPASVEYYMSRKLRTWRQSGDIAKALYSKGRWYEAEFGEAGDWGVTNPSWGTAFLDSEWLLDNLCPRWRVVEFATARNADNQDVYVLQRV